jgi:hypothetical protein
VREIRLRKYLSGIWLREFIRGIPHYGFTTLPLKSNSQIKLRKIKYIKIKHIVKF